ncbi:MAG: ribosome recycling factor [Clostridia bacterium]|nr:ribosome recycling factor [Clostridia bacterium]
MQDENQTQEIIESLKDDLEKSVLYLKNEYQVIRAGRANPHILDKVLIDYYGVKTPLKQMANMSVQEARLLVVSVYDISQIRAVTKAITEADLGVNISDDGRVVRLAFPVLTEERRREIAKSIKVILENTKVAMRNSRRDSLDLFKQLKKDALISEDDMSFYEKEVQKIVDEYIAKLDALYILKEKEIMEV